MLWKIWAVNAVNMAVFPPMKTQSNMHCFFYVNGLVLYKTIEERIQMDIRWKQRFENFEKAFKLFAENA
jgi:hypothetical protein